MILDRFRLDGQVATVTGAGRGLGAAMALAFAEAGADVVIAARTESQLEEVAEQIRATGRRGRTSSSPTSRTRSRRRSSLPRRWKRSGN